MFLNFFSELKQADKIFFGIVIGAILIVLIWLLIGKLIRNISNNKKEKTLQREKNTNISDKTLVETTTTSLTEENDENIKDEVSESQEEKEELENNEPEKFVEKVEESTNEPTEETKDIKEPTPNVDEEETKEEESTTDTQEVKEVVEDLKPESVDKKEKVKEDKVEEQVEDSKPAKAVKAPTAKKSTTTKQAPAKTTTKKSTTKTSEAKTTKKQEIIEESNEKKGRSYNGKYEVFQAEGGYQYRLKASNGEILVNSETYSTRDGVIKAIDVVKKNIDTGIISIFDDKQGKYKFKLTSKNYRVLVLSSNYSTEKSCERASESFKKFALTAEIVDVETKDSETKGAQVITIDVTEDKQGGKFIIEKFNDQFSWSLKASNGQILCQADGYSTKAGCLNSIESFKKNIAEGTFKCVKDKTGRFCYKLYTPNGRICAVGESYPTKVGAESAANSVVSFYKNAEIEEIKENKE